jgi:hypothetical protein
MINYKQHYKRFKTFDEACEYVDYLNKNVKIINDSNDKYITVTKNNSFMYRRKMNNKDFRFRSKKLHAVLNYKYCNEFEQLVIRPDIQPNIRPEVK